jgi:hypothetical protein
MQIMFVILPFTITIMNGLVDSMPDRLIQVIVRIEQRSSITEIQGMTIQHQLFQALVKR